MHFTCYIDEEGVHMVGDIMDVKLSIFGDEVMQICIGVRNNYDV